ncbi:DNA-binding LacI/PurR family transcriptional regulator [Nocardioides marinisabuli]|uniref:DNA-binding LacI/PurR family transcriptional regulator n=1 Tax=Nocardioides marinisabuli TaxID=419476 RepID=A0A7Y9F228_9ACTN|nr:DNA-binding LacI/PurR family transcriptional regulator [Nocardioides marinisabuli]
MTTTERRPGGAAPTLEEVAREAGVSRATASRAINGGSRVSPRAQAAVAAAVRTLGYTPNPAARSLMTRRTDSVAVVVPEPDERVFSDPFFSLTLRSVHRVLDEHGLQLVLLLARRGTASEQTLRYLSGRPVDGALITSHHRDDGLAGRLADLGLPCVFGGRPWDDTDRVSWVDVDQVAGGRMAAEALLQRGRRVLATVTGPEDMTAAADRLTGWRAALGEAGVAADRVAVGDFTEVGGEAAARELLARHPDVDGVFAASDLMAAGVLKVLAELGRRVPEDVAVVGFDDLGGAETTTPTLTTVHNPVAAMAEEATRMLLRQIGGEGPASPVRVVMPTRLVRRESC